MVDTTHLQGVSTDSSKRPLCIDLDGTLVRSDLLVETLFALLKQNILTVFLLPLWLVKGKAYFKQQIADRVDIDPVILPYHESFLEYLKDQHARGRRLILVTASNVKYAEAVALYLGIFDDIMASDRHTNLSGKRKLARLTKQFGVREFDYAANGRIDLPVWSGAGAAVLVNPERGVREAVGHLTIVDSTFDDRGSSLALYIKAMRLHQWIKNLLIFVPLILAHRTNELSLLLQATLAFFAFGFCASSAYLLNDLLDLPSDRQHQTKRHRPFAAGSISIVHGAALIPMLVLASFTLALLLPTTFVGMLCVYYVTTLAYSFFLKRAALLDVLVLAGLYTLRIIAGAAAVAVSLSFWLLAFSMFLFLSLALIKRYTELFQLSEQGIRTKAAGRGYNAVDLETLMHFGTSSAYMAVLVLALYINSEEVDTLYARSELIWLLCPILLYIVSRIWLIARRGELHEDPIVFALQDRRSQMLVLLGAALLWMAI